MSTASQRINGLRPAEIAKRAVETLDIKRENIRKPAYGLLVAVEGIDGAGISTLAESLAHALKLLGLKSCYTKEPTYGSLGFVAWQMLRGGGGPFQIMKDPKIAGLVFAADRLWHLVGEPVNGMQGVYSAIAQGCIVVTDRYKYSSIAYQSTPIKVELGERMARLPGAPEEWLWEINKYAPPPHLLVYIDVPVKAALERIFSERFSIQISEQQEYLELVRIKFKEIIARLRREPEYQPPDRPGWADHADLWGPLASKAWLDPERRRGYPMVEEVNGLEDPVENLKKILNTLIEEFYLIRGD